MASDDAFCTIPDSLLAFILSKLPLRDAVKSSILSKRWRFLYTKMPELTFHPQHVLGLACFVHYPLLMSSIEQIISNVLLVHSGNLEAFHLHGTILGHTQQRDFSHDSVCKWVRYASLHNVKHLTLFDHKMTITDESDNFLREMPPPALFQCTRLVTLRLRNYFLTSFPVNFVGFPHLVTCDLCDVQLTDESLAALISLCPHLQKFETIGHAGLDNAVIFSSTIEHLSIGSVKSLSIDCPKLKILKVITIEDLSVNGIRFYELSYAIAYLGLHCGSIVKELVIMNSESERSIPGVISASRFLHIIGNFQSLKTLVIHMADFFERESHMDVPLFNLLYSLPNLHMLGILGLFAQELARDPVPVCLTFPHQNLKKISVEILEFDHKEVEVISCLLQSTPSLEELKIQLPEEYDEGQCLELLEDVRCLRRSSLAASIIVLDGGFQVRTTF